MKRGWLAALLALTASIAGCTRYQAEARADYWRRELTASLPVGASQEQATQFFAERGLELRCCSSGPGFSRNHYVRERDAGRQLWMTYDVNVLLDFSPDGRLRQTKVLLLGVGL